MNNRCFRGWEQLEVTCNPIVRQKNNLWNVEEVIDTRCKYARKTIYTYFLEYNKKLGWTWEKVMFADGIFNYFKSLRIWTLFTMMHIYLDYFLYFY